MRSTPVDINVVWRVKQSVFTNFYIQTISEQKLQKSALAQMQQLQGAEPSALPTTTTRSLYDVKAMQKEAVLSYVKVPLQWGSNPV